MEFIDCGSTKALAGRGYTYYTLSVLSNFQKAGCTANNSSVTFTVNGKTATPSTTFTSGGTEVLGADGQASTYNDVFKGEIDEVRISNTARSISVSPSPYTLDDNTITLLSFNDNYFDMSRNTNNGIAIGSPTFVNSTVASQTTTSPAIINAPTNAKAERLRGEDSIRISWNDNSSNETHFKIMWSDSSNISNYRTIESPANSGNIASMTFPTSNFSVDYNFHIAACNGSVCSAYAPTTLIFTQAPADPTNVNATFTDGNVVLTWNDNANNEEMYQILWSNTQNGSNYTKVRLEKDITTWTHTGVITNTSYNYHVQACKYNSNCSKLIGVEVNTNIMPTTPSQLRNTNVNGRTVNLQWSDNSNNETKFVIAWSDSSNPSRYSFIEIPANTTIYTFSERVPSLRYNFHVKACNGNLCSVYAPGIAVEASSQ